MSTAGIEPGDVAKVTGGGGGRAASELLLNWIEIN